MTHKLFLPIAALALVGLTLAAPLAAAATSVTATAKESGCPKNFCFDVSPTSVPGGDTMSITFSNPSSNTQLHSFCVAAKADKSDQVCTTNSQSGSSAGSQASITFTAPATGNIAYWCNVPGHAALGMTGNFTVASAVTPTPATPTPTPTPSSSGKSTPAVGAASILAGIALLAIALRKR